MTIKARDEAGRQAPHEPTEASREFVRQAAGLGLPQPMIGVLLRTVCGHKLTENTLRKYYADELEEGVAQATLQVTKTLFHRAVVSKDLGAICFWLKSRAGWREKHVLDDPANRQTLADLIALSGLSSQPQALPAPEEEPESKRH